MIKSGGSRAPHGYTIDPDGNVTIYIDGALPSLELQQKVADALRVPTKFVQEKAPF